MPIRPRTSLPPLPPFLPSLYPFECFAPSLHRLDTTYQEAKQERVFAAIGCILALVMFFGYLYVKIWLSSGSRLGLVPVMI